MGLESKTFRRWLAAGSLASQHYAAPSLHHGEQHSVAEPPTYIASFNPFPALCIGITGTVMAAHYQPYVFQVQIHTLWGNLLTGFALMRWLTYFFLWLGPPRSTLPSRPPTEAIASFFLACGGLVFMFSTEEVTIAAMRRGHDGEYYLHQVLTGFLPIFSRRNDVPQCRGCDNMLRVLLVYAYCVI